MGNRRSSALLFLFVFWVMFVLGGYYYYHKPINVEMIIAPLNALIDILIAFLFAGVAGGIGRRFLAAEEIPPLERAVLQSGLGSAALGLLWLVLGALGLYHLPLALPLLLAGLLVFFRDVSAWYGSLGTLRTSLLQSSKFDKLLAGFSAILLLYQLLVALAPPTKWDALTYHLQLPRQYLAAGSLVFVPENPYWGHPQLVEMLYTFATALHRAQTAAVLGWVTGVLFLIGLFGFTNHQLARLKSEPQSPSAGWMAVSAVLVGQTFRHLLAWSYTDLFSALFGLAALIAFFSWLDTRKPAWFLWAGFFAGVAIGTKWTAGVLVIGLALAALIYRKQTGLTLKVGLLGGLIAFLTTAPWILKNLLVTGSPFYPYFIGTPWFDAARLASANQPLEQVVWWQHLFLPFTTTWTGVDSAAGFSADLGPLLLLFALPGFWAYWQSPKTRILAILLIPAALAMGLASLRLGHLMQTRLYFVLLPGLAAVCGWGWDCLKSITLSGVRLRRILNAIVILVTALVLWQESYWIARVPPSQVILGQLNREGYLEKTLGYYAWAMQTLQELPSSEKIIMLWEPRGFYAPPNARADLWIDRWRTDRRALGTAQAILQSWKRDGFTYMLLYQQGVELIRPKPGETPSEDWLVLQQTLDFLPEPQSIGDLYYLYRLN